MTFVLRDYITRHTKKEVTEPREEKRTRLHLLLLNTGRPCHITWPHRHYNTQDGTSQLPPKRYCKHTRLHGVATQTTPVWTTCDALPHCHLQTATQKGVRSLTGTRERHDSQPQALVNKYCELQSRLNHAILLVNKCSWQLKNSHYSRPLTKPHHLLPSLVGYITMLLSRDVPCRNKPENEIIAAHPAIPERRRRSRPGKVQLT